MDNPVHTKAGGGFLHNLFAKNEEKNHAVPPASALNLPDVQGLILRGYRMPMVRHFLLEVGDPAAARKLFGRFISGDESDAPQITTARDWHIGFEPGPQDDPEEKPRRKPDYCLNVGITWPGMIALEIRDRVPTLSFKSFGAFTAGAAQRAALVGDIGPSAPEHWVGGFGTGTDHVLVTLHAISPEAMATYSDQLAALFSKGDAFREVWRQDGAALMEMKDGQPVPTAKVHFGYTDGISMTTIRGGPERYSLDHQQPCEPWLFVLMNESENYFVPEPHELGLNGSFAVFKMIETDVVGFEEFLQSNKEKIDPELLAAKMCGRWRNGVPLALSPDTDRPPEGIAADQFNNFEYVNPDGSGDPKGLHCPIGAHMRRINPRGQPVTGQGQPGGSNNTHRLIRRGLPYGPMFDPSQPYDGIKRGLLGYFINSNIENQYEFVLGEWVNKAEFAGSVRLNPKSKDPMVGTQDPEESIFVIPQKNGLPPIKVTGLSTFVSTKAAAYCFLPSVTALKFISSL
ncbi:Dyp-type peroxidase [Tunturiibacter gelidoferens]|jgi:deferrochelatase/peroxidase EfeB|uniref:Deferrochelatase/peroxidase EfeB n=1 Tax=Tunturiibacter gelidiferens TaxID=3069689 RepID=A0A9X0QDM9_9BACT|nr:peroxidase [Edaphobacter lichenicola]MBB5328531.1 deferrochelatase/peroxidase EfeB [Edaphobacter lichenicola]